MRIRKVLARMSLLLLATTAGCGKEASGPTGPSPGRSFLEGTWSGTLTIERPGEPASTGQVTWTFQTVDGTNLQSFRVTIRSQHAWLPITTTGFDDARKRTDPRRRVGQCGRALEPLGGRSIVPGVKVVNEPEVVGQLPARRIGGQALLKQLNGEIGPARSVRWFERQEHRTESIRDQKVRIECRRDAKQGG